MAIDLTTYAGEWIAQRPDARIVASAPTLDELEQRLASMGVDVHDVGIMEIPRPDGVLLL